MAPVTNPPTSLPTLLPTAPPQGPRATEPTEYELLSGSIYTQCPSGREVPQGDCLAAANVVTEGWTNYKNRDELLIDDWNFTPCGCFVYNNQMIDYDANCGNSINSAASQLVCKKVFLVSFYFEFEKHFNRALNKTLVI